MKVKSAIIPPFPEHIRFRNLREFSGLSQVELSKKLGVTQSWVSKIESGNTELKLTLDQLLKMREIYNLSLDQIVTGAYSLSEVSKAIGHYPIPRYCPSEYGIYIKSTYPLLKSFESKLGKNALKSIFKKVGIVEWQLAAPYLLVHSKLLTSLIKHGGEQGFSFDREGIDLIVRNTIESEFFEFNSSKIQADSLTKKVRFLVESFLGNSFCDGYLKITEEKKHLSIQVNPLDFQMTQKYIEVFGNIIFYLVLSNLNKVMRKSGGEVKCVDKNCLQIEFDYV